MVKVLLSIQIRTRKISLVIRKVAYIHGMFMGHMNRNGNEG